MIFSQVAFAAKENKALTKEDLLKGSPVPLKREFPLSTKVSPCEDFHKYVCSNVETKFKLPADRERWNFSFTDISERLLHAKKTFFKNINNYTPTSDRTAQFKDMYLSCMNEKSATKEEKDLVAQEKKTIADIKTWQELADLSQSRIDQGQTSIVEFDVNPNKENPLRNDAFLIADMRTLPERSYYEKKDLMAAFEALLVDFFKTLKVDKPEQRAKWVVEFETALAMKFPLPKDMRERATEKRDISRADFLKKYPNLKTERFIGRLPAKTVLIDLVPESNEFINNALATMPIEQLKSVYMFHDISEYMDDAYPAFFNKYFKFRHKYLGGPEKRSPRQERCTKLAMFSFGNELDEGLLPILFPDFPEDRVVRIGENMRSTIIKGLEKNSWLSSSTKKEAVKKIQTAKLFLVKPKTEKDWDFMPVSKYDPTKPKANMITYGKMRTEKAIKELSEDRSPTRWEYLSPLVVNAYYSPPDNKFVLLQGILQFPFFDPDSSDIENMAAIGTVVGHELGHGIDDEGSKYDYSGKVRQWFSEKDLKTFNERGARFVDQFTKIGHDGKLTLGENIGDHVGLTFAYNAAFQDAAQATEENKKKFFVAYARMWCNVATPSYNERQLKTNPHSLGQERINQQVIHIDGFYDAYKCKAGDKMFVDAKDRIRVW
jgi:putative endopeptidase